MLREEFPGASDKEIARTIAKQYGYEVIVAYKNAHGAEYDHIGCCHSVGQATGYLDNSYCKDPKIIFDSSTSANLIDPIEMVKTNTEPHLTMNNRQANKAMWRAIKRNNATLMGKALGSGCDIHRVRPEPQNNTPLSKAAEQGQDAVVRLLLEAGAKVDAVDEVGRTALHFAAMGGKLGHAPEGHKYGVQYVECTNSLLSNGADVNAEDNDGRTALILSSQLGNNEIVQTLLDNSANIDTQDNSGLTALMVASNRGRLGVQEILIAKGANIDLRENDGGTALTLARTELNQQVLRDAGARQTWPTSDDDLTKEDHLFVEPKRSFLKLILARLVGGTRQGNHPSALSEAPNILKPESSNQASVDSDMEPARQKRQEAHQSFNTAMQEMRDLPVNHGPLPRVFEKVIGELSEIIDTTKDDEWALYLRARSYYYAGRYADAIQDIDTFFSEGHHYDVLSHGEPAPTILRAMARIALQQFEEAWEDLDREIQNMLQEGFLDELSIRRSKTYYWLLVCKHKGNEDAALEEHSQSFNK